MCIIAPSLLEADYKCLGEQLKTMEKSGAEYVHIDVMDGSFVPNLACGMKMIHGLKGVADLVFDVRCLPNPYYIPELKEKSGLDKEVRDYVMGFESSQTLQTKLFDLIDFLIPQYLHEGKSQLVIAFGCTGGKHRSATFAENMCEHLSKNHLKARVLHRDVNKDKK